MRIMYINKNAVTITVGVIIAFIVVLNFALARTRPSYADDGHLITGRASKLVITSLHSRSRSCTPGFNYGIIIDAGSTGSRLFLYQWRSSGSADQLISIRPVDDPILKQPVVKKVSPGLSSFANQPQAAAEYIRPLLEFAEEFVPHNQQPFTPVYIFATAGMRLLSLEKQQKVMNSLHERLPSMTRLQVLPQNVQVISGKWEGIYSWIGINYILGRFQFPSPPITTTTTTTIEEGSSDERPRSSSSTLPAVVRPSTAGMIDMGGASAQIAFELPGSGVPAAVKAEQDASNVEVVNLGVRDDDPRFVYHLFVTTFLGFGVNEAAKRYEHQLIKDGRGGAGIVGVGVGATQSEVDLLHDDCLPNGLIKLATAPEDGAQFVRKGTGNWDSCVKHITALLRAPHSGAACPIVKSCFLGEVAAPSVSLSQIELYGFSEYWYSVDDVLSLGGRYDHNKFEEQARSFCSQRWMETQQRARADAYPKANEERLEMQCFKSAWIHSVLHDGFFVDEQRHHFQSALKIKGEEVQWALGAMIYQMRHFPLMGENGPPSADDDSSSSSLLGWLQLVSGVLFCSSLITSLLCLASRRWNWRVAASSIRRDPSSWGYKILSQLDGDDLKKGGGMRPAV